MNADTLALAVMDDDGYGCAITSTPASPYPPPPYRTYDAYGREVTPIDIRVRLHQQKTKAGS